MTDTSKFLITIHASYFISIVIKIHNTVNYLIYGYNFYCSTILLHTKGKGIPITGHEGPWGMWMQGSTYTQPRY